MKYIPTIKTGIILIILMSCQHKPKENEHKNTGYAQEIHFYTPDSIKITGDLYEVNKKAAVILLFHQARSNAKGEYNTIIPKLTKEGYNVLAIDQRSGGQLYGSYNRTVAGFSVNNYTYCDVYTDLETALDYTIKQGFSGSKILWGSSYSAALAIQLGHKRQNDVAAVLAFSPASGGPMQECTPNIYFESIKTPMLLLRPGKEMEMESVKDQFDLALKNNHQTYIAEKGVHGSSMLVKERTGVDVKDSWNVVLSFIKNYR